MSQNKKYPFSSVPALKNLSWAHIIILVIAFVLAIGLFVVVRGVVVSWNFTNLPGVAISENGTSENDPNAPVAATPEIVVPPVDLPAPWDGASRVNILVMGLDFADFSDRDGPSRTDTMILVSVDPITKTAAMLSIPRDLWVEIPGYGHGKINTAHAIGEGNKLPGGGPAMAAKAVEQVLGVPVDYYAVISFDAFTRMVNELGCINIWSYQAMDVDPIGPGNTVHLDKDKGYCMDGDVLLAYARNRHTEGGDVDRAHRQQQVILALKDKILDPANFPGLVAKAPALYQELATGITTNLSLDDALQLAVLAQQIPTDTIKWGVIDYKNVTLAKSPDGLSIFVPIPDKIRELRDSLFGDGSTTAPFAQGDIAQLVKDEGATVAVWNGSGVEGLGQRTADYLKAQGVNVVETGNPPDGQLYQRSKMIDRRGKPYFAKFIYELFKMDSPSQYEIQYDPASSPDVILIVGGDWAASNSMP